MPRTPKMLHICPRLGGSGIQPERASPVYDAALVILALHRNRVQKGGRASRNSERNISSPPTAHVPTFLRASACGRLAPAVCGEFRGSQTRSKQPAHRLVIAELHAAIRMMHHEPLARAEQLVGDDERTMASLLARPPALRMTRASPSARPANLAGSSRASMQVRMAKRRAGGSAGARRLPGRADSD
jgi:hypothetical protein